MAVYREVLEKAERIKSAKGVGSLKIHSRARKAGLDVLVACERPARLRLEALDFWDQVVFLAIVRNDVFLMYAVTENRFLRESADSDALQENFGIPLEGRDLVALVLGCPIFVPLSRPDLSIRREERDLVLTARQFDPHVRYQVRLDRRQRPLQSRLTMETGRGSALRVLQVDYSQYRKIEALDFPFRIHVTNLDTQEDFVLKFHQLHLNPVLDEGLFEFVPPGDAEEMRWP